MYLQPVHHRLGACEGSVACSTCHVILSPEHYEILPEPEVSMHSPVHSPSELILIFRLAALRFCLIFRLHPHQDDENDMLDMAFGLTDTSRLGCQVRVTRDLDGMSVMLPSATRNMFVDGM